MPCRRVPACACLSSSLPRGWCVPVTKFKAGNGQVTVQSGGKTILSATKFLTPGPLVCVIKGAWPPKDANSVECIAASFVPSANSSKVRLFNLAMDIKDAALHQGDANGPKLADDVPYTLGSKPWTPVPATSAKFTATDALSSSFLTSITFTPPPGPEAFTTFLLVRAASVESLSGVPHLLLDDRLVPVQGTKAFGYTLVPQIDAPEFGPCRPQ